MSVSPGHLYTPDTVLTLAAPAPLIALAHTTWHTRPPEFPRTPASSNHQELKQALRKPWELLRPEGSQKLSYADKLS